MDDHPEKFQLSNSSETSRNYCTAIEHKRDIAVYAPRGDAKFKAISDARSRSFDRQQHTRHRSESPAVLRQAHGVDNDTNLADWQGCLHLIKGTVGTGILAMPSATKNAGIVLGPLGIFLTAIVIVHAMHLLVKCAQFLRKYYVLNDNEVDLDYSETVRYTLRFSSTKFRKYFFWLPHYLQFALLSSQVGFLSVYLSFVSENTKYMVDHYDPDFGQPIIFYQGIVFVCLIPLAFAKSLKQLAKFSGLANFLAIFSALISLIYFLTNLKPYNSLTKVQGMDTIPMFFGVIVFAFESINLVLPVENRLSDKKALLGFGGILNLSMIPSVCLFTAMAFYGYLSAGDDIKGSFTYNVPMTPWYLMIVKPMYTLSIYISYGLQYFVALTFIDDVINREKMSKRMPILLYEIIRRGSLSVIVFLLASLVPHVDLLISLVGAFSGSAITLQYPAFLHAVLIYGNSERLPHWKWILVKDGFIFMVGIFGAIIGTYTSIVSIINTF